MGKIVKFCTSCEEGFAEKFSFCPNCASELSAFEMKPVEGEEATESVDKAPPAAEPTPEVPASIASEVVETAPPAPVIEETVFEPVDLLADSPIEASSEADKFEIEVPEDDPVDFQSAEADRFDGKSVEEEVSEPVEEEFETVAAFTASAPEPIEPASYSNVASLDYLPARGGDDNYAVTVISERNTGTRNGLLLASCALIITGFFGIMVFSLFNNLDDIPALNEDPNLIAYLNDTPLAIEEREERKGDNKKDGGGGGGGKNEEKPASAGVRPPMMKNPTIAPSSTMTRVTNPELRIQAGIQGPIDEKQRIPGRYGVPGSLNQDASDGTGDGGGIGSGRGRGVGSGNGTGFGSGNGSGIGSGDGDGIGDGDGTGRRPRTAAPRRAPPSSGPSTPMVITSKPRPGYTEEARKASLTGTVRLRVTFNANGTIGSITPLTRLGNGLTEKAIAAARSIRFKPEMRNGRAIGVKKTIAYNFSIY